MTKKEGIIVKTERFELHHRIAFFCAILLGAIVVTRLGVLVHYPGHAVVLDTELHHFDYGIIILLLSSQLSLFGPRRLHFLYMILIAVGSGLILDEYWMIRHGVVHAATRVAEYNSTIPSAAIMSSGAILLTLFMGSIMKKRRNRRR